MGRDELQRAIDKIAKVVDQLVIVLGLEIVPSKVAIGSLWSIGHQVVAPNLFDNESAHTLSLVHHRYDYSPYLGRDIGITNCITKDTNIVALGELGAFIVEVLARTDAVDKSVVIARTNQRRREHHRMERNIILQSRTSMPISSRSNNNNHHHLTNTSAAAIVVPLLLY
jgi:hypothetical protein